MTEFDDLPLRRDLRALRVDSAPTADLWPGIEARIRLASASAHRSQPRVRVAWLGAIAAGLLVALGLLTIPNLQMPRQHIPVVTSVPTPAMDSADTVLTAYTEVLAAEQAQGAQWQRQLTLPGGPDRIAAARELDVSLAKMAAALRVDPQSQLLRRLMHQTLQQRAALTLDALDA